MWLTHWKIASGYSFGAQFHRNPSTKQEKAKQVMQYHRYSITANLIPHKRKGEGKNLGTHDVPLGL
jgi:hypothetical protein